MSEYAAKAAQLQAGNIHLIEGGSGSGSVRQPDVLRLKQDVPNIDVYSGEVVPSNYRRIFGWMTPRAARRACAPGLLDGLRP